MAPQVYPEPPDGGWGWMIVLAAFMQTSLVYGVIRSFGVFFVEFVQHFEELSGRVSWITSIGIAVQQFASPVASALSSRYGARPVVMLGAFLSSLGMFLAAFATRLMHLYLSIGLLSGWLRDLTGNYYSSFGTAGGFLLAGCLVLMTLPNFFSCLRKASTKQLEASMGMKPEGDAEETLSMQNGHVHAICSDKRPAEGPV